MQVRLIDGKIPTTPGMLLFVTRHVNASVGRFARRVAEVKVRIADENGPKGGVDKRCVIVARLDGDASGVVVVRRRHADFYGAIAAAAHALKRRLARDLGDRMGRSSRPPGSAGSRRTRQRERLGR